MPSLRFVKASVPWRIAGVPQEALAAGSTRRPVEDPIEVTEPVDFLIQITQGKDGEARVADVSVVGLAQTPDRSLI